MARIPPDIDAETRAIKEQHAKSRAIITSVKQMTNGEVYRRNKGSTFILTQLYKRRQNFLASCLQRHPDVPERAAVPIPPTTAAPSRPV